MKYNDKKYDKKRKEVFGLGKKKVKSKGNALAKKEDMGKV